MVSDSEMYKNNDRQNNISSTYTHTQLDLYSYLTTLEFPNLEEGFY